MRRGVHIASWLPSALLLLGLALLLAGERVLGADVAGRLCSGGGVLLVLCAAALRVRTWRGAAGDQRSVEARLFASYAAAGLALLIYAFTTETAKRRLGLSDETASQLGAALTAAWTAIIIAALSALLFMEAVYARMPAPESVELRRVNTAAGAGLALAFSLIFVFSVNYVASERDVRRDLSYFRTTRPSAAAVELARKLDQPVAILLFYRRADDVLERLRPYFEQLAGVSRRLQFKVTDVAWQPELARRFHVRDNGYVLLLAGQGEQQRGETIEVGTELTRARRTLRRLDGLFQQKLRKLTAPSRMLRLTVGHGERNSGQSESNPRERTGGMEALLGRLNIETAKLGLAEGLGAGVPEGTAAVAIVGPRERFLPEEVKSLRIYLLKGGRLLLMLDPGTDLGLGPLLEELNVELIPGVIASEKYFLRRDYSLSNRGVVYSNRYSSHPVVTTASRYGADVATIFYRGAALRRRVDDAKNAKLRVAFPLRTEAECWLDLDQDYVRGQNEPEQTLNMIAAVEINRDKGQEGRAVIIADGDFATDQLIGNTGNFLVLVDALAWLIADETITADVASEEDKPIEHTRDRDKIWFYATSFAAPLPIVAAGLLAARRRRRRAEAGS